MAIFFKYFFDHVSSELFSEIFIYFSTSAHVMKFRPWYLVILAFVIIAVTLGIAKAGVLKPFTPPQNVLVDTQIANPASENCVNSGGTLAIKTADDGGQYGICTLPSGKECEEWAYLRGECS